MSPVTPAPATGHRPTRSDTTMVGPGSQAIAHLHRARPFPDPRARRAFGGRVNSAARALEASMKTRFLVSIVIAVVAVVMLCAGGLGGLLGGGTAAGACLPVYVLSAAPTTASSPRMPGVWPAVGQWDGEQVANAAAIVTTGAQLGVPARGWVIAVATAMQESTLRNLPGGDRDSVGLFQQRPSQGWGNPAQLQNPVYAAGKFYVKLLTISGWQTMPLTEAAQAVQISAFPDAYAKWEGPAAGLVSRRSLRPLAYRRAGWPAAARSARGPNRCSPRSDPDSVAATGQATTASTSVPRAARSSARHPPASSAPSDATPSTPARACRGAATATATPCAPAGAAGTSTSTTPAGS